MSADPIGAVPGRCGCAGKTPLDRVVRPAVADVRASVPAVRIADDLEAGLLPNTAGVERTPVDAGEDEGGRAVTAAFLGPDAGTDREALGALLSETYRGWADGAPLTVLKGHSIQIDGAEEPIVWGERFRPTGERRPGYRAVNVDVIHALPGVDPTEQAAIAAAHALNDCYTQGAAADRELRPIVAGPEGELPTTRRVRRWFRDALPAEVSVRRPALVGHDGRGWQLGAAVAATTRRAPPVRAAAVEPGDAVLLHRPLGALAVLAGAASDVEIDAAARERALEALSTDHAPVAGAVAASSPPAPDAFDPERHLKWVGDVSGPGIGGLTAAAAAADCGLEIDSLPLLDRASIEAVRRAWTVPDATVETNGPLAAIGSPAAIGRFRRRLAGVEGADPRDIGRVIDAHGALRWDESVAVDRYVETPRPEGNAD